MHHPLGHTVCPRPHVHADSSDTQDSVWADSIHQKRRMPFALGVLCVAARHIHVFVLGIVATIPTTTEFEHTKTGTVGFTQTLIFSHIAGVHQIGSVLFHTTTCGWHTSFTAHIFHRASTPPPPQPPSPHTLNVCSPTYCTSPLDPRESQLLKYPPLVNHPQTKLDNGLWNKEVDALQGLPLSCSALRMRS